MLRRAHRLGSTAFEHAFGRSRTYRQGALSVRVHWRDDDNFARAAFVVPKKLGQATWRNRVRRRLRAVVAKPDICKYLQMQLKGSDLIFFATPQVETIEIAQLETLVRSLLERIARDRRAEIGRLKLN